VETPSTVLVSERKMFAVRSTLYFLLVMQRKQARMMTMMRRRRMMAQRIQRMRIMLDSVRFQILTSLSYVPPCASLVGIVFSVFVLDDDVVV